MKPSEMKLQEFNNCPGLQAVTEYLDKNHSMFCGTNIKVIHKTSDCFFADFMVDTKKDPS